MNLVNKLNDALERALLLIENDGVALEDCLARFSPPEADRIRPLLEAVLFIKEQAADLPGPVDKAANKARMLAELAELRAMPAQPRNKLSSRLARSLAASAAILALTVGVAAAAGSSGPESPLYPIKRAVETVQAVVPRSDAAKAGLHLGLAETRLNELEANGGRESASYRRLSEEFLSELDRAKEQAARLSPLERQDIIAKSDELKQRYDDLVEPAKPDRDKKKGRGAIERETEPDGPDSGDNERTGGSGRESGSDEPGSGDSGGQSERGTESAVPESDSNNTADKVLKDGKVTDTQPPEAVDSRDSKSDNKEQKDEAHPSEPANKDSSGDDSKTKH